MAAVGLADSMEASEADLAMGHTTFADDVVASLEKLGVYAKDITGDELGKTHAKHLAGGRAGELEFPERIIRFEFPERPGALSHFLDSLNSVGWNVSLFQYRNHGADIGRVLAGVQVPPEQADSFDTFLDQVGYRYHLEDDNEVAKCFL